MENKLSDTLGTTSKRKEINDNMSYIGCSPNKISASV